MKILSVINIPIRLDKNQKPLSHRNYKKKVVAEFAAPSETKKKFLKCFFNYTLKRWTQSKSTKRLYLESVYKFFWQRNRENYGFKRQWSLQQVLPLKEEIDKWKIIFFSSIETDIKSAAFNVKICNTKCPSIFGKTLIKRRET